MKALRRAVAAALTVAAAAIVLALSGPTTVHADPPQNQVQSPSTESDFEWS